MGLFVTVGAFLLAFLGIVGIVLPGLPDLPLVYAGLVLRSATTGFTHPPTETLLWLLILLAVVWFCDLTAGAVSAKQFGASRAGVLGALIGSLFGLLLFMISPWAIFVLPILGAMVGELRAGRPRHEALKSGVGTTVGFVAVIVVKFLAALVLVGFLIASFF